MSSSLRSPRSSRSSTSTGSTRPSEWGPLASPKGWFAYCPIVRGTGRRRSQASATVRAYDGPEVLEALFSLLVLADPRPLPRISRTVTWRSAVGFPSSGRSFLTRSGEIHHPARSTQITRRHVPSRVRACLLHAGVRESFLTWRHGDGIEPPPGRADDGRRRRDSTN